MRPFQWLAVAVCIVLNLIDGFDVLVMAFTASSVAAEWNLGGAEIGLLLSAGLSAWPPARCSSRPGPTAGGAAR